MRVRLVWPWTLAMLCAGAVPALSDPAALSTSATVLHVPDQFRTIRRALKRARPGDRIVLAPGTYRESVVCKVPGVTIDGRRSVWKPRRKRRHCVKVRAGGVTIEDVRFRGGSVQARADDFVLREVTLEGPVRGECVAIEGERARLSDVAVRSAVLDRRARAAILVEGNDAAVTATNGSAAVPDEQATAAGVEAYGLQVVGDRAQLHGCSGGTTRLAGPLLVEGDDVQLTGCSSGDGRSASRGVVVIGDGATVFGHVARSGVGAQLVVRGDRARVHGSAFEDARLCMRILGDDAVVSDNEMRSGSVQGIVIDGERANVKRNVWFDWLGENLRVEGDDFSISRNAMLQDAPTHYTNWFDGQSNRIVDPPRHPSEELDVDGAPMVPALLVRTSGGGQIAGNDFELVVGSALRVEGDGVALANNWIISSQRVETVIEIEGDANVATDNRMRSRTGFAIRVVGHDNRLVRNEMNIAHFEAAREGLSVVGDRNELEGNEFVGNPGFSGRATGAAFFVEGDDNRVADNRATDAPGHGFVLEAGARNAFVGNRAEACLLHGFVLTSGSENRIEACESIGNRGLGLDHRADMSVVIDSRFRGNVGADLLNLGSFDAFERNDFLTRP